MLLSFTLGSGNDTVVFFVGLVNQLFSFLPGFVDFVKRGFHFIRRVNILQNDISDLNAGTVTIQRVVALAWSGADPDFMPLVKERASDPTGGRAYVCRDYACQAPVESVEDLRGQLGT